MAKKRSKLRLKSAKSKVLKALDTIIRFNNSEQTDDILSVTDIYQVDASTNTVRFTLEFNTIGVAATTDAFLEDIHAGKVRLVDKGKDSLRDISIGKNKEISGKFLQIDSIVTATPVTPLPTDLKVNFSIIGGVSNRTYTIPPARFKDVGDSFIIDIQIFFYSL